MFHQIGKTTPKEDRRQIIELAICEAAREYTPDYGNLVTFFAKTVALKRKQFFS